MNPEPVAPFFDAILIGEGEEAAAEGNDTAVERHSVHDSAHGVFANAVVEIPTTVIGRRDRREAVRRWPRARAPTPDDSPDVIRARAIVDAD